VILKGKSANGGFTFGKAIKLVNIDYNELSKTNFDGKILIVKNLTPDLIVFINKISGIISENGGITSHAAIIAIEFNIPCVVGVKDCMSKINNDDYIRLDANEGIVDVHK